ncbi:non-ribosomal peptide synthetase [Xenorhabdus sp. KK7.4]|uniref:non-ribosomal peptide synthetase n=1 Tax=Xenorhabdus sp. KK7.4 TaxID=1851572 RepID=UPI000C039BF0|nr:non-ribosomal peptide synthetase [Xenorhabdus sp. KK7.4]PHM54491.1 Amino acid adenylation [Xenorhabdus sp. KK7.4]
MLTLFKELNKNQASVWVYENKLKLTFTGGTPPDQLIDQVKQKKENILNFLNEKNIFSVEDFRRFISLENSSRVPATSSNNKKIEAIFPATSLQQGFVYHYLSQPQDDAYRVQLLLDYHTSIDVDAYQQAWTLASRRFPILRTAFDWEGEILQIVTTGASIDATNFRYEDITELSEEEKNRAIDTLQQHDLTLPFDLRQPGLARFTLIKQRQQLITVVITLHHSIIDGWSYPVLLQTVHGYYNALVQGHTPEIVVDKAYLNAQQYYRNHQADTDIYWAERKAQWQGTNDLSALLSHRVDLTQIKAIEKPAEQLLTVQGNAYEQLKNTCRIHGITLNVALQFAWHKLLHIYTADEQTIVGTTVSGRDIPVEGIESSVGLYINTLPLAVQWKQTDSVVTVLQHIQKNIADLNSHSAVSLASLQSDGERLFHSLLVFENYPAPVADENQTGIEQTLTFRRAVEKVDYPLSLIAYEQDNRLVIKFNYGKDWLTDEQALRLLRQLERILHEVAYHPEQSHTAITCLSEEERHTLLHRWNQTDAPYPQDKTLPQLFEAQAAQHPDATAVEFEEQVLSYGELNCRANRLAHYLMTLGVGPDERVAICVERSPEMVVGLLAILKAGGAYVPLDPALPDERLAHMLRDSAPVALLTQSTFAQALEAALPSASHTVLLDKQPAYLTDQPVHNPDVQALASHHLAYVIYTSGSTGLPKGVEMPQSSLSNLLHWHHHTPEHPTTAGKTLQFAALGFDVAFQEIFTTLCEGSCLVLIHDSLRRDPQQLLKLVQQQQIERLFLPYVALQHFAEAVNLSEGDDLSCLKHIITAGEQLRITPAIQRLLRRARHCRLHNHYGPTESHVVTSYTLDKETEHWSTLPPIGRPIANTQIYILDPHGQPVPWGVTGEIYIAGKGVAHGYLNRPELTAERFLSCPFSNEPGTRMYKTGDLGRWLPDGNIDYLGRNDFQVKVRGFRIELGEIESALMAYSQIKQAVVIDREHQGHKVLAAYLVAEDAVSDEMLLAHLSDRLPDYMLPASFTFIDAIPLTSNGKVNRRALPEPVFGNRDSYVAPRNVLETQLCAIWQDVLALERVGIDDNFFRIGGNSLTAIKLIAAIRRTLSTDISLAQLFELKTIAGLATQMDAQIRTVIPPLAQARYPLSFAQERMLFIEQFEQGSDVYHIPYLVQLAQEASLPVLEAAINRLAERHAVLSTVYRSDDHDQMYQQALETHFVIPSQACDDRATLLANVSSEIATPFDLATEPSLRLRHYQVTDSHYLLLLWHHIAMDGWSTDIFMAELAEVYHALQAGRDSQLPELEITYGDYAAWQRDYLLGDVREQQLTYWQQTLAGYESLALPTDHPRPAQVNYQGRDVHFALDAQLSEQLRTLARTQETTLYTVLLSAFYVTLAKLSGQDDIVIGTPTDNRHHAQTLPLLGMFVNSLALRVQLQHTDNVAALMTQTHKLVTDAKAHQDMPFEQLLDALNIERDTARHPLFQVMFSVQTFGENPSDGNLPFSPVALDETLYSPAKFDLSLFLSDGKTAITGCLNYAVSLFNDTSITRIAESYQRVLRAFVADQQQPLSNIDILSAQERHTLLHRWNQTDAPYPQDKTLSQLFEAQAAQRPDAIAITFEHQSISYGELNRRANRLAHHLIALGVRPDDRVGICLERSLDMVVGILAILKASGAYLPLDPAYPTERLSYMLEDATPVVLLTQTSLADKLTSSVPTVWLDNSAQGFDTQPDTNPDAQALGLTARHLAYVIYTSGSTGQPKGVMVEHRNVLRLIINNGFADIGPDDCVAHCANPAFDAATWEIWSALLNGSCLHIVPHAVVLEPTDFREALRKGKVTALWLTAGLFNEYLDTLQPVFGQLSYLLVGGDVLNPQKIKQVLSANQPPAHLLNGYGPTESTTFATTYAITAPVDVTQSIPIGRPIANTRIYLLDAHQQPVPMGVSGEIYISGEGVARGYLNQPELTAERFLTDPYSSASGAKMYKTGDMGRYLPDGNIDYLGRNDSQVKVRGFRIELGEIENALAAHPQVKQAVVIDREHSGHKVLAAYLVIEDAVSDDMLLTHLSDRLPDYMLPASFTFMDAIPLTLNGKVNRRALPEPVFGHKEHYVAPRNALETQLCAIWQDILALERVGIDDNFFRIGGNSLTAIKLIAAIRRTLSTDISLAQLFELKTIAGLATQMDTQIRTVIPPLAQARYPLSFAQERMLFIEQFEQGSDVYHIPYLAQLTQDTSLPLLEAAINRLAERHAVLSTVYRSDDHDQMYQQALETHFVIPSQACDDRATLLANVRSEIAISFDLTTEPSLRLRHYQVADRHYLLLLWHHIAMDGWSIDIFMAELAEIYHALQAGHGSPLPELEITYGDYAAWQRDYLQGDIREQQLAYWQQTLAGYESLALPIDHPRPAQVNYQGRDIHFALDAQLSEQLRTLAKTQETTLYTVLLSAFYVTLAKLSGQDDIVIGTPTDNRHHAQTLPLLGMFVNSLALRAQLQHTDGVTALIAQVHKLITGAKAHQDMPFEQLIEALNIERDTARHPLFQVMFSVQAFGENPSDGNLPFSPIALDETLYSPAKFDLSLFLSDGKTAITGCLNYAVSLFNDTSITRIAESYQRVLRAFVADQQQPLSNIDILSAQERHTLLHRWNQTDAPYPKDKTLPQLFEAQAAQRPDAIAITFEHQSISYGELNRRANQLAHHLIALGVRPDDRVGICLERSMDMVVGILAILKAGGAYLPLDPDYPAERLAYMLDDASPVILLTQTAQADKLASSVPTVWLDNPTRGFDTQPDTNPNTQALGLTARHLAYVIYTSGSTGKPKGVMVEHRNILRLIINNGFADIGPDDCVAHCANPAFDAATWEIWSALLNGSCLHIVPQTVVLEPTDFREALIRGKVTALWLTAGLFNEYLDTLQSVFGQLRYLLVGGDVLNPQKIKQVLSADHPPAHLLNGYGPTESTTFATTYAITAPVDGMQSIPIGRPIANTRIYLLDAYQQPVPMGAPGEIYISGEGVARGYLNQPELTTERFLADPFSSESEAKMYKTGDLGRYLPDGSIDYLGRNDFQIKIRGFRIELGEIESALAAHPQVKQVIVIDREHSGHKVLAAYLVVEDAVSDDMLLAHLSDRLPDYMLPASFTFMEAIPLTLNGKVNRRALPEPVFGNRDSYVAPRNVLETQLCAIWQDVLALERVGIDDNFFRIGGNSLTAIKLIAAIRRTLSTDISLAQLFELKTIAGLATQMDTQIRTVIPPLAQARYPLSFAQERMLFIEQFEQGSDVYHIPYLVQLTQDTSLPLLEAAINRLAERHAVLSTVYRSDDHDQMYQQALETHFVIPSQACDDRERLLANVRSEIAIPFDLTTEPSLRLRHYQVADNHYLLLLWHHIAMDGWSTDIFMAELAEIYHALQAGRDIQLPALDITYGDYAAWQRDYLQGDIREQQLAYWQHTLVGYESLALPTDHPRPAQVNYQGRDVHFALDAQLSEQLRTLARTQETTLYTVLLSAFYVTLAKLSGQDDIVIGTPTDNRHHAQTLPLLGMFVNSLALRAQLQHTDGVTALIAQVHKLVSGAKAHQDMPFEQLIEALNIERDTARHPLFQVMFSVQAFGENPSDGNLPFSPVALDETLYSPAKFDLSLFLSDGKMAITGCLNYAVSLFNDTSITRIAESFQRVLRAFVADQQQPLSSIDILSAQERHTLLTIWNQTDTPYPQDKTLQQLFEAQAAQRPDATAITFEHQSISYGELNRRANQLAHHLIALGVRPDDRVGICLERSLNMVVGILAILKSGGAYLPLDPAYPAERLAYMLEDATPVVLLTQTTLADKLACSVPTVLLDNPALHLEAQPDSNPDTQALGLTSNHLAYVIYTSGSTGQPKGVMVEHRNILRLIINNGFADIGPDDCVAHCANPAFDAATWEIWSALLNGSCLHIVPHTVVLEPTGFREALIRGKVTALWLTAGLFNEYLDTLQPVFGQLRYLLVGGDVLNPQKIKQVLSADHPPAHLINGYGPTESTTFATTYAITAPIDGMQSIPIGRPIANTRIYLLDAAQQMVAPGAIGELYIGGAGVARGYLNQPKLTAESFLPDPFSSVPEARMYKTGDLGRYLPDGNIDYLGRNDSQVKVRGFRIELGEIENALAAHPQVKQAVVIDREHSGHKVLAAYLVIEDDVSDDMLLTYLSDRLPDYMLPASFTFMEAIPLTLNGKVNRRALPEPVFGNRDSYVAPRNALENQLCAIWQDILALERVGIEDNFFRIGGNSLLAIKLTSAIRHKMTIDIPLNILFNCKCIALLSQWLVTDNKKISLLNFLTPESMAMDKLFMIHPANGGSESYAPLANILADSYNCIGIDNYNLSTDNQIDSLQELANIYMQLILTEISINQPIRILGWSLGGQLAMEIAYQLEQIGVQKIQLFLLDTVINNAETKILRNNIDISNSNLLLADKLQEMGASETYINKVLKAAPFEYKTADCDLSGILKHTNITLFKAGEINPDYNDVSQVKLAESIIKVTDNNISQWATTPLEVILLKNHHHNNILECTSVIRKEIINALGVKETSLI